MDEEEKPPTEARDKTVVSPAPVEKPREGGARTRTGERKLTPAAKPAQAAGARTATGERKLTGSRPKSSESSADVKRGPASQPSVQALPGERKLTASQQAIRAPQTGNVANAALSTQPGAPPDSQPGAHADEDAPFSTLPGAPHEGDDAPPVPVERTVMVPFPEPPAASSARGRLSAAEVAAAMQEASEEEEAPASRPVEPTVVAKIPSAPPVEEPHEEAPFAPTFVGKAPPPRQKAEPKPEPKPEPEAEEEGDWDSASSTFKGARQAEPPEPEPAVIVQQQPPSSEDANELAEGMKLGGYQLIKRIGAGAMGTVWLASQLSLDREVAVKILRPGFATDPQFVYRFTQEAFAAAQLIHHNIVQIHDCGSDKQYHFFSMEYVDAQSLQTLVKRGGPLDPEEATGYVLQAARGLKFAHDRGMVHRDIKPDNLLLNNNGIVKVADMGLVKLAKSARARRTQSGGQTPVTYIGKNPQEYAMGTPAYMAPEQVENSSKVDARADIYSLGCTLYHLLTGRAPFLADTVSAVMEMHVKEPAVPPNKRNAQVPETLSAIVMRMMAKRPDERFQSMGEVIQALEAFLGFEGTSTFSPREQHANLLEQCVLEYNDAHWARRRRWMVFLFTALSAVVTGLLEWKFPPFGLAVAGFTAATWIGSFVTRGLFEKGALFLRFRQYVFQAPLGTWAAWLLVLGGVGYGLSHFQLLLPTVFLLGLGLLVAIGFYVFVDRKVEAERRPPISQVEQMLRSMRLRGLEEGAIRQFVCTYSGDNWEAFYEALFGYDAKILARKKWGLNSRELPRARHSTWRDPLIRLLDALQEARQRRKERRQLKMLERKKLKAQEERKAKELREAEAQQEAEAPPEGEEQAEESANAE